MGACLPPAQTDAMPEPTVKPAVEPDLLIRPDGQVERLDRPAPAAVGGSYEPAVRLGRRGGQAVVRDRRTRARYPERPLRGRLVDVSE